MPAGNINQIIWLPLCSTNGNSTTNTAKPSKKEPIGSKSFKFLNRRLRLRSPVLGPRLINGRGNHSNDKIITAVAIGTLTKNVKRQPKSWPPRSEERRVGKECRAGGTRDK